MEAANDPIQALLEKTGLSCDDLLQKLLAYKSNKSENTTDEIVDSQEIKNESHTNYDVVSSGKTNGSFTNGACSKDFGHNSNYSNEEKVSRGEHSSERLIYSSNDENSSEVTKCATLTSSENVDSKEATSRTIGDTADAEATDNIMESQSCQMNVMENISRDMSNDYVKSSQKNLNSCKIPESEQCSEAVVTKETQYNTSDESSAPKKYGEGIPETYVSISEDLNSNGQVADIQLQNLLTDKLTAEKAGKKNLPEITLCHTDLQSSGETCLRVEKAEDTAQVNSKESNLSKIEDILNSNNKIEDIHSSEPNASLISRKRKSISDELVRRLVVRVSEDEINDLEDEYVGREQKTQQFFEDIITNSSSIEIRKENEIAACQIEVFEKVEPVHNLLKLKSDVFENDKKTNFTISESKCDNEKSDVDSTYMDNFLETIEEVRNSSNGSNTTVHVAAVDVNETDTTKIRKVKVGFLKKKILHRAIRHLNRAESSKFKIKGRKETAVIRNIKEQKDIEHSFQVPLPKLILEPHVDTPEAQEEIRKSLKLQLNSLRNRKKTGSMIEQDQCKKVQSIGDLKFNYKKQLLNDDIQNSSIESLTSTTKIVSTPSEQPPTSLANVRNELSANNLPEILENNDSSLFSLCEDTNFLIVDVQGGVDFLENDLDDKNKEFQSDAIKLTKTKDITKIKGWKNKKFDVVIEKDASNSEKEVNEIQTEDFLKSCDILSIPNINKDDSNSAETLKMDENSSEELSPFVSNSLEEFLTENSRLNISYKIPKLGAEEGLRELNYKDVVALKTSDLVQPSETEKKDKPKGIKPKTLAEKRRMLERKFPTKEHGNKGRKLPMSKTSYIYFNGRKLYIPSTTPNKCLASIQLKSSKFTKQIKLTEKSDNVESEINTPKKLSLLKLWLEKSKIVTYKPGPLSQKQKLQNSETIAMWDTVVQKLPEIKLEIIPEFGKPIPPHLLPFLPKHGPVIKSDYLEFALTAVQTKPSEDKPKQGFRYSIPYANNQKYILMRKKKVNCEENIVCAVQPEKNSVASVMHDIINYVEIKEIADSLIKDAEPYEEDEYEKKTKLPVTNEINIVEDSLAKNNIKRRKLQLELQRLNCKVVSVTVEEKEVVETDCNKSFCKLGCICRSLACASHLPLHCSKKYCMLECKCCENGEISLGGENSLLSSDTVTRIEDQAKRNLAKVEKEFTQTIIHANNKTILIPSSDRSKTKRLKRTPKRYSDFLENYDVEEESETVSQENEKTKVNCNFENYICYIQLQKLDLKTVVPLCLDHNRYNCSCIQKIEPITEKHNSCEDEESFTEENISHRKIKTRKLLENENIMQEPDKKPRNRPSSCGMSISDFSRFENRKKIQIEGCARIFGVHPEFVARNEIPYYKNKLKLKIKSTDNSHILFQTLPVNLNYRETRSDIIDVTTPLNISGSDRLKLLLTDYSRHKRKQVLEVRDDSESIPSLQKPKKLKMRQRKSQDSFNDPVEECSRKDLPYTSIFDGEIVIPTHANKDFVKTLGVKNVAPYMRLLPWNDLLKNYYGSKISIWCSYAKSDKLLINVSNIHPPEGYVDITKSKRKNGIMMWILTKQLPKQTPAELVHLILSPNNEHFEISGICLKNIPRSQEKRKMKKVTDEAIIENKVTYNEEIKETVEVSDSTQDPVNNDPNFLEHKNHKNEMNVLCLTQHEFCPQYLYLEPICEAMCKEKFPIGIELPIIRQQFRWRMLYLNSNFSFLSFINNKYSIKYTDLMHILKKAQCSNKTICLQSKQLSSGYSQKNYGIYAVPKYPDRLFIGPYKHDEEHGLETLRYLRKSLVSTSYFEMVQGGANPNNKNAVWLITKMFKRRDKETHGSNLSLLLGLPQQSLLKPTLTRIDLEKKENTEIYIAENSQFAELTPILDVPPPLTLINPAVSDITSLSLEVATTTTPLETKRQYAQTNELRRKTEHSQLLEGCENFITSMDLEERPFIKFPEFVLLNGKKMKPQEYNRYIMTNVPHFGYLGAIQNEKSKAIDIDWPFANKVLRFPNVTSASEFLKRRFTNLLLPVPASFQINLIILREIDSSNHSPIDAKILSGTHICGEFGVLDSRKLTQQLAESLGTTQEDVLKRLAKRAQYLVRCRLRTLGLFLLPKDEQLEEVLDNVAYITNLGALEIGKLKEQEKLFIQTKKDLIIRKQNNLTKYMELLMHLPEKQRLKEYDKFRHQFNERPKNTTTQIGDQLSDSKEQKIIECIEIEDSDSEHDAPNVCKTITTPKHIKRPEQPSPSYRNKLAKKSVFRPIRPAPPKLNDQILKPLEGYKFVKTSSGKLVLLKDNSGLTLSTSLSGMKMTIRNNQVVKRDIISIANNASEIMQGTSEETNVEDFQELDKMAEENSQQDNIVELEESDEENSDMLG